MLSVSRGGRNRHTTFSSLLASSHALLGRIPHCLTNTPPCPSTLLGSPCFTSAFAMPSHLSSLETASAGRMLIHWAHLTIALALYEAAHSNMRSGTVGVLNPMFEGYRPFRPIDHSDQL